MAAKSRKHPKRVPVRPQRGEGRRGKGGTNLGNASYGGLKYGLEKEGGPTSAHFTPPKGEET